MCTGHQLRFVRDAYEDDPIPSQSVEGAWELHTERRISAGVPPTKGPSQDTRHQSRVLVLLAESPVVISVTLDTSCAQHFLTIDEEPDEALIEVIAAALRGQLSVAITEQAVAEVGLTADTELRRRRLARLKTFDCLVVPAARAQERDSLAEHIHDAVFPDAVPGSRTDEHNWRDCLQLATHKLTGRRYFLTRDEALHRRSQTIAELDIAVLSATALMELARSTRASAQAALTSVAVRSARLPEDEPAIREVLGPLADDYPDFDAWLTGRLRKADTQIRVGTFAGSVGAVALSSPKDSRVLKLSAFYVAERARAAGLGGHLLWQELQQWIQQGFEKVYVTVSSRHADLLGFFAAMGFLVEGGSPRRYQADTVEFVLAKHLLRERITADDLETFAADIASTVFRIPADVDVPAAYWSYAPAPMSPELRWEGSGADTSLVADVGPESAGPSRRWGLLDLERIFYPASFALAGRRALIVPIERRWAGGLVEYAQQQQILDVEPASKLLLRVDNAYYCYPKSMPAVRVGSPILLYVTEPVGAVIGEARIYEWVLDTPEELLIRFGDLGIYGLTDIRKHVRRRGPDAGKALALRFGHYLPFESPVDRDTMVETLGRRLIPQGVAAISFEEFEALQRKGGR